MLNQYLQQTAQLLQNPSAPQSLYTSAALTGFINSARGQLAGDSESIRVLFSLPITSGKNLYNFSSVNVSGAAGVQGIFNIRTIWYGAGSGMTWIRPRSFEWFSLYELNNTAPSSGPPLLWSQYMPGVNGSFYISPIPNQSYTLYLDCVCQPIPLTTDSTIEAIPYAFTDCVQYFAAYLALLSAQSTIRQGDAQRMKDLYTEFMNRARRYATPEVLPFQSPKAPNPVIGNQLGISAPAAGGAG